ncbi:MAG: SDR family oxidoreductase [Anaerolineales bacterium]|nr:SDR family oxidoreductase [Anaerolineales bacterium]
MKVLVTGGAGFIGSHVVEALLAGGHAVSVVDNLSSGRRANLPAAARLIELDIRDPRLAEVFEQERPDWVAHHAAQVDVRRSVADPLLDADINVRGGLNVLESARRAGVRRFVYASTGGAVYGEPEYLPVDERHPVNPLSPYGASKHALEHYLYLYQQNFGLTYVVLRYPNVYGPRQDPHGEGGVIAIFTDRLLRGAPITIYGDGEQTRDFTFVEDCARANLLALENPAAHGIYNLGTGQATSINQVFATLKDVTRYSLAANYGPAKVGETRFIYSDASRARMELGWQPEYDLRAGLARTVAHFRGENKPA